MVRRHPTSGLDLGTSLSPQTTKYWLPFRGLNQGSFFIAASAAGTQHLYLHIHLVILSIIRIHVASGRERHNVQESSISAKYSSGRHAGGKLHLNIYPIVQPCDEPKQFVCIYVFVFNPLRTSSLDYLIPIHPSTASYQCTAYVIHLLHHLSKTPQLINCLNLRVKGYLYVYTRENQNPGQKEKPVVE